MTISCRGVPFRWWQPKLCLSIVITRNRVNSVLWLEWGFIDVGALHEKAALNLSVFTLIWKHSLIIFVQRLIKLVSQSQYEKTHIFGGRVVWGFSSRIYTSFQETHFKWPLMWLTLPFAVNRGPSHLKSTCLPWHSSLLFLHNRLYRTHLFWEVLTWETYMWNVVCRMLFPPGRYLDRDPYPFQSLPGLPEINCSPGQACWH